MATSSSAAKRKAPEQSASTSTLRGAPSSGRLTHRMSLNEETRLRGTWQDRNERLRAACESIGRPELYEGPEEQEVRDLGDPRNRSRGEGLQRRRLERGWFRVESEALAMRQSSSTDSGSTHYDGVVAAGSPAQVDVESMVDVEPMLHSSMPWVEAAATSTLQVWQRSVRHRTRRLCAP